MTLSKRIGALFLSIVLLFLLCACGGSRPVTFKVIAELNQEEFRVAFRKDDPLCDIVTAAMRELAADGQLMSYMHRGFWQCMDNMREKETLDKLLAAGRAPWKKWED